MAPWYVKDNNMYDGKYDDIKPHDKKIEAKKEKVKKDNCCCCSEGFRKALLLLNDPKIVEFIQFNTLGLIGKKYTVGGSIETAVGADGDNFLPNAAANAVTLQCVDCNLAKISSATTTFLYPSFPGSATAIPVAPINYWSLCDLDVVILRVDDELFVADSTTTNIRSWNDFKTYFRTLLDKNNPQCDCHKDCNNCCCSEDIFNQLNLCIFGSQGNTVNLTAGVWRGEGLEVLGRVGCVLILTNNYTGDTANVDPSIFFVCLNSVGGIYSV